MRLLLDTHILIWAAQGSRHLSAAALALLGDHGNTLAFSPASLWEIAIKSSLGRLDFDVDPHLLYRGLRENGYEELVVDSRHALAVRALPLIHRDPFDRMLIAQATVEGITLVTHDDLVSSYPGPIRRV